MKNIRYLLYPKSIAILGASTNLNKFSGRPLRFLLKHGYGGRIYPVNPKPEIKEILGVACFHSLKEIDEPVDQVMIALPAHLVVDSLIECAEAGVKSVVLFSSGFAEIGQKGREMQDRIMEIARSADIALCGPNCQGLINLNDNVASSFTNVLELDELIRGNVGFISQSGALAGSILSLAQKERIGFSHWISVGNEAVLDVADFVGYLAGDPLTRVIVVYAEGIKDANRWVEACEAAAKAEKPVIVMKTGRSETGGKAIMSHTGSVAGEDSIIGAFFHQNLCLRVNDIDEMLETIMLFSADKGAGSGKTAIFSSSGGAGIILADACSDHDIDLARLSDTTRQRLKERLPKFASVINPIDVTAQFFQMLYTQDAELMTKCLNDILEDEATDILIIALTMVIGDWAERLARDIALVSKKTHKPVAVVWMAGDMASGGYRVLRENGIPLYSAGGQCVKAVKNLVAYTGKLSRFASCQEERAIPPAKTHGKVVEAAEAIFKDSGRHLTEHEGRKVLSLYDIAIPAGELARSEEEAVGISGKLTFPLVLKIDSPHILHKTDAGCVITDIRDEAGLVNGYRRILENASAYKPDALIRGILIEEMISRGDGIEVIVGMKNDSIFGPAIILGLGGVFVEVFKETVCGIAPLTKTVAEEMIRGFRGYPILKGTRGRPRLSMDALRETLLSLNRLSTDFGHVIAEIDINPLMVLEQGRGVMAADVLIIKKETGP